MSWTQPHSLAYQGSAALRSTLLGELDGAGVDVITDTPVGGRELLVAVRDEAVRVTLQQGESVRGGKARSECLVRQPVQAYRGRPDLWLRLPRCPHLWASPIPHPEAGTPRGPLCQEPGTWTPL